MIETLFHQRAHEKLERYRAEAVRLPVTPERRRASAGTGPRAG